MLLGIDLGGTKLALATFDEDGRMLRKSTVALEGRGGGEVGALICESILSAGDVESIGISVPGICRQGTVWAPNLPGWEDYPLLAEVQAVAGRVPVALESDRTCYISGELWQGNARGCKDAIFLAVGTGIGAGILVNGTILQGSTRTAGAIGWMALSGLHRPEYVPCGCFEHHASGEGIAHTARQLLKETPAYTGELRTKDWLTAHDVFAALERHDSLATAVLDHCIHYWGMAVANLVSLFNPEKIILGGGVFGPAARFLPRIRAEAEKWAQPVSIHHCRLETSALGDAAGVYGAAYLALNHLHHSTGRDRPEGDTRSHEL